MVFKLRNNSKAAKELKSLLETIVYQLQKASQGKSLSVDQNTYSITKLFREDPSNNKEMAIIRAEAIIREKKLINAYDILEAECKLITENSELINNSKSCPPELLPRISTLVYASERVNIDEMSKLLKYFKKQYGSKFVNSAKINMDTRIAFLLSIERPAENEVHAYLANIVGKGQHDALKAAGAPALTALPVGYAYSEKEVSAMIQPPPPPSNPTFYGGGSQQLREVIGINNCNLLPSVTGTSKFDRLDSSTRPFTSATNRNMNISYTTYDKTYFKNWMETLKSQIGNVDDGIGSLLIPSIENNSKEDFDKGLKTLWDIYHEKNAKNRHVKWLGKQEGSTEEDIDNAKAAAIAAEAAVATAKEYCQVLAQPILEEFNAKYTEMENSRTGEIEQYETLLCQCAAICRATPAKLAAYCAEGEENKNRIMRLFTMDTQLLKHIMINGDASPEFYEFNSQGLYGEVMEIYENIIIESPKAGMNSQSSDTTSRHLYNRIAIACACEFAIPKEHYGRPGSFVDPVARYMNYEKAYDDGLLDPNFDSFTTWELRMIVNSDLLDSELDWIRYMEMNYRPDLTITDDKHWIYTKIVKTDCKYKNPVREDGVPFDIMQHFSGGGKCGPRARAGRAVCKAFGIPTWGAKTPGHAYLTRWTSKTPEMTMEETTDPDPDSKNHWTTNLGAKNPMHFYWGTKKGTEFFIETQLRERYREQQEVYGRRVCLFEWLQCIEDGYFIVREMPRANEIYLCLADCQKYRLYENEMGDEDYLVLDNTLEDYNPVGNINTNATTTTNQFTLLKERVDAGNQEMITSTVGGGIMIPASTYDNALASRGVSTMKSYLGGNQILLEGNSAVTYKLPANLTTGGSGYYQLSCKVCTIHADQISNPFTITVSSVNDNASTGDSASNEIIIPYTIGGWETTAPITIVLTPGRDTLMQFSRSRGPYSVSMKGISLVELGNLSPTNGPQMTARHLGVLSGSQSKEIYIDGQLNFGINRKDKNINIDSDFDLWYSKQQQP